MPFSARTVAITVTYNPDLDILQEQLKALSTQCKTLFIDNHSSTGIDFIVKLCKTHNHTQLLSLDSNSGISSAQNIGIQHIRANYPEVEFVLLLDHDSVPSEEMVQNLEDFHASLTKSGKRPAAVGPHLFDPRDGKYLGFHVLRYGFIYKKSIPSSHHHLLNVRGLTAPGPYSLLRLLTQSGFLTAPYSWITEKQSGATGR